MRKRFHARGEEERGNTVKHKPTIAAAVLALALVTALPLPAQNTRFYRDGNAWVEEETGSLPAARNLRVQVEAGAVTVQGGAQNDFRYTVRKRIFAASQEAARRALEPFRITASRSGDAAVLEGRWEGARAGKFMADISLQVPRELALVRVENQGGGAIAVRNIAGRVEAQSGGGAMQLSDIAGGIKAETGGGSVDVSNSGGELELSSGGGGIHISGSKGPVKAETAGGTIDVGEAAELRLETGGGSIDVKQCNGDLRAETAGGSIDVGQVAGGAVLETGGGSIRLASAKGRVMASTGAGTVELYKLMQGARVQNGSGGITAEFLGGSDSMLETGHGDIVVYLSPQAKFTVRASVEMANGHKIVSDFPELKITNEGGQWGPRNAYAEGSLNGGGPTLRVRTNLGNIEFRRAH